MKGIATKLLPGSFLKIMRQLSFGKLFGPTSMGLPILLLLALTTDVAAAAPTAADLCGGQLGTALNNIVLMLNGGIARSLAILGVVGFGVAALVGKVEWSRAMIVILGVGILFGATTLVNLFAGTGVTCTSV